jgi:hypothetical protein
MADARLLHDRFEDAQVAVLCGEMPGCVVMH